MASENCPHDRIARIIEVLLEADEDVTARAVARAMDVSPSTITRSPERMRLVQEGQASQGKLRTLMGKADKAGKRDLVKKISDQERRIVELESDIQLLTASHKAMVLAIGELGGFARWQRFFSQHQHVLERLNELEAMPQASVVKLLKNVE